MFFFSSFVHVIFFFLFFIFYHVFPVAPNHSISSHSTQYSHPHVQSHSNIAITQVQPHSTTTIVAPKDSRGFSVPLYHIAMLYKEEFNLTKASSSTYDDQRTTFTTGLYDKLHGVYVAHFMVGDPP